MSKATIWEGVADQHKSYPTEVTLESNGKVCITQHGIAPNSFRQDIVILEVNEAIDIAFAILRDLAPTVHETLSQLNVDKDSKV